MSSTKYIFIATDEAIYKFRNTELIKVLSGSTEAFGEARRMKTDSEGNVYIIGSTGMGKYSFDLVKQWEKTYTAQGYDIDVWTDGTVAVCGWVSSGSAEEYIIVYDSSGTELWSLTTIPDTTEPWGCVFDSEGNLIVSFNGERINKYNRITGSLIQEYDDPDDNRAYTIIATDKQGNIYFHGNQEGAGSNGIITDNDLSTVSFYVAGNVDVQGAIVVSPDGLLIARTRGANIYIIDPFDQELDLTISSLSSKAIDWYDDNTIINGNGQGFNVFTGVQTIDLSDDFVSINNPAIAVYTPSLEKVNPREEKNILNIRPTRREIKTLEQVKIRQSFSIGDKFFRRNKGINNVPKDYVTIEQIPDPTFFDKIISVKVSLASGENVNIVSTDSSLNPLMLASFNQLLQAINANYPITISQPVYNVRINGTVSTGGSNQLSVTYVHQDAGDNFSAQSTINVTSLDDGDWHTSNIGSPGEYTFAVGTFKGLQYSEEWVSFTTIVGNLLDYLSLTITAKGWDISLPDEINKF